MHDTTVVEPYPLLFFGGKLEDQEGDGYGHMITVDGIVKFHAPPRVAQLVQVSKPCCVHLLVRPKKIDTVSRHPRAHCIYIRTRHVALCAGDVFRVFLLIFFRHFTF